MKIRELKELFDEALEICNKFNIEPYSIDINCKTIYIQADFKPELFNMLLHDSEFVLLKCFENETILAFRFLKDNNIDITLTIDKELIR